MKYEDFFQLPHEERDRLMAIHRKQSQIRIVSAQIKRQYEELNRQYKKNQEDCLHPFTKKEHIRTEDYGCAPDFSTKFYCPDCDKHWHEEGSK
jgi:hypothetical protein